MTYKAEAMGLYVKSSGPMQFRIFDSADLEEVYNTERHLLYVACTRARDRLMISGKDPASEFLDDLGMGCQV